MKNARRCLFSALAGTFFYAAVAACPAHAEEAKRIEGFHNDSELGIVVTGGNTRTQTYNLKQLDNYGWDLNLLKLEGKYLKTNTQDLETAKSWSLGLRYERELADRFSVFAAETLEADPFAGYLQRYNTDLGGKYFILKNTDVTWTGEAGYRYTIENRLNGRVTANYLRFFSEANYVWTKTFTTLINLEYLPNLTDTNDYQLNSELSGSAAINEIFAIKAGYQVRYRKLLIAPATVTTDTQFTTALVAKF